MRWLLALLLAALYPLAWGEGIPGSWSANEAANVSGDWRISACSSDDVLMRVRQDGSRLSLEQGNDLEGRIQDRYVWFLISGETLGCQPGMLRFEGDLRGARIVGELRSLDGQASAMLTIKLRREFMLSFDDGPLPGRTDRVLDALRRLPAEDGKPVRAAFFTVGKIEPERANTYFNHAPYELWQRKGNMWRYPELTKRIVAEGHALGNHTAHHAWFRWPRFGDAEAVLEELRAWENALPFPYSERLFRPPYLVATDPVFDAAFEAAYQVVLGEMVDDALPWAHPHIVKSKALRILEGHDEKTPALLVFHDIFAPTYNHLGEIVTWLEQQGYVLAHFDARRIDQKHLRRNVARHAQ